MEMKFLLLLSLYFLRNYKKIMEKETAENGENLHENRLFWIDRHLRPEYGGRYE